MNAPTSLDDLPDDICAWCGAGFTARLIWQKYCCEACRHASRAAFLKQVRRAIWAGLKCRRCGEPIEGAIKASTRYCGPSCRTAAAWERKRGRLSDIRCMDCGGPIPGVARRDTKRCADCLRARHRKASRERARRSRQTGRFCQS